MNLRRTIRLKARIIFTWHDMIMLWWVLDMTHRQTEEPGWNNHGVSLARWDSLQTDYSGCRGLLVSCVCPLHVRLRPSLSSSVDLGRADTGGQPCGTLSRRLMRESRAYLQPRSRIVPQHAALVDRLGCVLLAGAAPLWPEVVRWLC